MLFKIDENLHSQIAEMLRANGHDAATVVEENLKGSADGTVAAVCKTERRTLVTLDLDFSNIHRYPPTDYSGLIVLRLLDQSRPATLKTMQRLLPFLDHEPLAGRLWIVDEVRIRIRE